MSRDTTSDSDATTVRIDEFVRVKRESVVTAKTRRLPPKPTPASKPPSMPALNIDIPQSAPPVALEVELPSLAMRPDVAGGPYLGSAWAAPGAQPYSGTGIDTDVIPIVRVRPIYPRQAMYRGLEGWVDLEFTINKDGTVSEPVVIDSRPRGVFNQSAMLSIKRWKFRPKIVDGKPVERRARQRMNFSIDHG